MEGGEEMSTTIVYTCNVCGAESNNEMPELRFEFSAEEFGYTAVATEFMHVCLSHNIYVIIAEKMNMGFPRTKDMICRAFSVSMPLGSRQNYQMKWQQGILDQSYPLERG